MATKTAKKVDKGEKVKATKLAMTQLIVLSAYEKTFSSGKKGFFGKVQDVSTGKRYQLIGAVELAS